MKRVGDQSPHPDGSLSPTNLRRANAFDLARLRSSIKPFRLHWFPRLRSTSDHAAVLRARGELFAPAIVLAGRQTAGRGRGAHAWWSDAGCLTATFVLPIDEHMAPQHIPLLAGLAVRNVVAGLTGRTDIQLKWPNDLLFHSRKLGGLLCERVRRVDFVGLGLNVNLDPKRVPVDIRDRITSLRAITGFQMDLTSVLMKLAAELRLITRQSSQHGFQAMLNEYDTHHALVGRQVKVRNNEVNGDISGRCEGLDATGRLLIRQRGVLHRIIAGQVISQ